MTPHVALLKGFIDGSDIPLVPIMHRREVAVVAFHLESLRTSLDESVVFIDYTSRTDPVSYWSCGAFVKVEERRRVSPREF